MSVMQMFPPVEGAICQDDGKQQQGLSLDTIFWSKNSAKRTSMQFCCDNDLITNATIEERVLVSVIIQVIFSVFSELIFYVPSLQAI
jgi:hypothetical protein